MGMAHFFHLHLSSQLFVLGSPLKPVWMRVSYLLYCRWSSCFHFLSKIHGALSPLSALPLSVFPAIGGLRNPLFGVVPLVLHLCPYMALTYPFCMYLALPLLSEIFPHQGSISSLSNH